MKCILLTSSLALSVAGCTANSESTVSVPVAHSPTEAQIAATRAAASKPGFAGSWYEESLLVIGFTANGLSQASSLASEEIRIATVTFDLPALTMARDRTAEVVGGLGQPGYAVLIDLPRNRVVVESAGPTQAPYAPCIATGLIPEKDPVNDVPIANHVGCP